ncbi:MAG: CapA family protein [Bacteroidetes bacterium]|nr:CapA family protein [Bacteroidota bacterium]
MFGFRNLLLLGLLCAQCCTGRTTANDKKKLNAESRGEDLPWLLLTGIGNLRDSIEVKPGKDYALYKLQGTDPSLIARAMGMDFHWIKTVSLNEFRRNFPEGLLLAPLDSLNGLLKPLVVNGHSFFEKPESWPYMEKGEKRFEFSGKVTLLSITGVTAITRNTGFAADAYGVDFLTKNLKPWFTKSDWLHMSNEVSFTPDCQYPKGGTRFCSKEAHFQALLDLGCDIVELTGNHNRDYGNAAFNQTYEWYLKHGIRPFGGGRNEAEASAPLLITLKDSTHVAFVGFNELCPLGECAAGSSPGACRYDAEKAKRMLAEARKKAGNGLVICSVQFGEVDSYAPSSTQAAICKDLTAWGADLVYGSQAHQIQQIAVENGKPVYYGLGNFLFDQTHRTDVRQAFFLQNYIYKGKLVATLPVYTFMAANRQPSIATGNEMLEMKKSILADSLLTR